MENKPKKSKGIILDALNTTGHNIWDIIKIVVMFYIFLTIISAIIVYSGVFIAHKDTSLTTIISVIVVPIVAILGGLVQAFTDASAVKLIDEYTNGNKIKARKAIGFALRKFWRIIGASIFIAVISGIGGFIATIVRTFIDLYMGADGYIFSSLFLVVIGAIAILLTAFIIPSIIIEDRKVFESFKITLSLLFKTDGKVILKVLGLMIVAFIVIALSYLLRLIPGIGIITTYAVVLIGQFILVFVEVGKVLIFKEFRK